jgi:hypothetical protein
VSGAFVSVIGFIVSSGVARLRSELSTTTA